MIDLKYSKELMLRDLRTSEEQVLGVTVPTMSDEFVTRPRARVLVQGASPAELLPVLDPLLTRRFSGLAAEELTRDLLSPLKKAVGNAHKRGNLCDPRKRITVEIVVTPVGAFIEVRDQGAGFDVRGTLARFRAGDPYFVHGGSGFRRYSKARSIVSFADGGRAVLIGYPCAESGPEG